MGCRRSQNLLQLIAGSDKAEGSRKLLGKVQAATNHINDPVVPVCASISSTLVDNVSFNLRQYKLWLLSLVQSYFGCSFLIVSIIFFSLLFGVVMVFAMLIQLK